jgi:hypothetical protein
MAKNKIDFDTVRKIGVGFSGVEASTMYRSPALKVGGKLLACIPINKSVEPNSLALSVDFDQRAELIATAPDVYYLTDHYANYPVVLVRLDRIHRDALPDLLGMAWRFITTKTRGRKKGTTNVSPTS